MDKTTELTYLSKDIENCKVCLSIGVGKSVPGEGNPDAKVMFIGEAPGRKEAETGRPFVGRSGMFLRSALRDVGIDDKDVFFTSPLKYYPKDEKIKMADVVHGAKHLQDQITVIDPKVLVLMGKVACLAGEERCPTLGAWYNDCRQRTTIFCYLPPCSSKQVSGNEKDFSRRCRHPVTIP